MATSGRSRFGILTFADKALIGALLLCSIIALVAVGLTETEGTTVVVEQNGKITGRFPLKGERSLIVEGPLGKSRVEIRDGAAFIADSPCPQKTCVGMGRIHRAGEVVVCAPNRVLVRIEGKTNREVPDAVSR